MSRILTPGAHVWRVGPSYSYDWLVESHILDIHWSFQTLSGGGHTWEARLLTVSEIEHSVTPGGGLAAAQTVTITVAETDSGQSLRQTYNTEERMQGADLTVSLLPQGETYGNRIPLFTGKIDAVSWQAGTASGGGVATLTAVDATLHSDTQVPQEVLTVDRFPQVPDPWRGAILPMVYGTSDTLGLAPLLLLDPESLTYRVADHAFRSMAASHAVSVAEGAQALARTTGATVNPLAATLTLQTPLTEHRYDIPGGARQLALQLNVTNPANLIDDSFSSIQIGTTTLNTDGNGYGYIRIWFYWPHPEGANAAQVHLTNHRRNPAGATTVRAELIVRSVNLFTEVVQRDDLFRDGPYRHSTWLLNRSMTISPLQMSPSAALEVELEVLNEGGIGTGADYWEAAELRLELYYQADSQFVPIYLVHPWEAFADDDGQITGTLNQPIVQAIDVLHSIARHRLHLPTEPGTFVVTRAAQTTYLNTPMRFDFGLGSGGWYQTQMMGSALLDSLARQAACYLFPNGNGALAIARSRDVMVSELAMGVDDMANVTIDLGRLELVHSTFEVRYGWHVLQQRFTKTALATPTLCNHPDPAIATILSTRCLDSHDRYGPQQPYILDAFAIQDDATAFTTLAHLVNYHWTQQVMVTCDLPFIGIHLVLGDYITITHPELPITANGGLFEIIRLTHHPEDGSATSWPLQLVAVGGVTIGFDYFAIRDQTGVVWYWWINRAGELDWSRTPPSIVTRHAEDLALSPIPSWLEVLNPAGQTRYIFSQSVTGSPDVRTTRPPQGIGYVGSPAMRGQGTGVYYLDVPITQEVRVRQLRSSFDYFQILDQNGLTWYWWVNRAGEFDAGVHPPSLNTLIAEDLNLSPVPSWLVLLDATGATRYVYPSPLHGDPLVATTPPSVGVGRSGSPTVRGMGAVSWQWGVTAAQEPVPRAVAGT